MKLLSIILLIAFCGTGIAQTAQSPTKPAYRFSIGLTGGTVFANKRYIDLYNEYWYQSTHLTIGATIQYHFTQNSTLVFQPTVYNIHTTRSAILDGNYPEGKGNLTRIVLPVIYDLHNTNNLQAHLYGGVYYSAIGSNSGVVYDKSTGQPVAKPYDGINGFFSNTNSLGFSIGTGLSYHYKRLQVGGQLQYMVGFSKWQQFIQRERGYSTINALLAYSFN